MLAFIEKLGFPEKTELLLTVTAKMLQKHGLYRVSSYSARLYAYENNLYTKTENLGKG